MTLRVRLFGRPRIEDDGQQCPPPRGFRSWAVLARVALAERGLERRGLAAELFGKADDPLGALRWCLADLRRSLGQPELFRDGVLTLPEAGLWLDVRALEDGDLPAGRPVASCWTGSACGTARGSIPGCCWPGCAARPAASRS